MLALIIRMALITRIEWNSDHRICRDGGDAVRLFGVKPCLIQGVKVGV
ncbi:hypothetical protein CPCC7001_1066 [Cyanobium sp. PCC 7001]|nr:hypothetical protein CPCC7001_1066 [Cyanobium sp. PCC 7001]